MRTVEISRTFKKQYKRLKRAGADMNLLDHTVEVLMTANESELQRLWDHPLQGKLAKYREIHVGQRASNWVVQYQIKEDGTVLLLLQTGAYNAVLGL
jgi:mRNA interferase YafQ